MLITIICILLAAILVGCYRFYKTVSSLTFLNRELSNRNECLEEILKSRNAEIDTLEERTLKLVAEQETLNDKLHKSYVSWSELSKLQDRTVRIQQETMKDLLQVMATNRAITKVLQEENRVNKHLRTVVSKIEKLQNNLKIQNNYN